MSARALKFGPRESHLLDRRGEPIATARLRSIGDHVTGIDRFLALGAPALTQAAFSWMHSQRQRLGAPPRPPMVLALPSASRPGVDPRMQQHLLRALAERARLELDAERSSLVMQCRGGGAIAFQRGLDLLREGACEAVVVGGIDSYRRRPHDDLGEALGRLKDGLLFATSPRDSGSMSTAIVPSA